MDARSCAWNTNKVNVQIDHFFADLHGAFDRLEREFSDLPVVLTSQGDVFSAGIDFQYSLAFSVVEAMTPSVNGIGRTAKRICASSNISGRPSRQLTAMPSLVG